MFAVAKIPWPSLLCAALVIASCAAVGAADEAACDFPAVFNFGDSNSDTGGLSAAFGAAPAPNGETYFRAPAGRYCDGRLVVDFIAGSLGLPYLSAYLDSLGSNFTHGANFATAGSTIMIANRTLFQSGFSPFSLDVQYWQFSQFKNRSQVVYQKGGVFEKLMPKEEYFSRALYTFDIGQNDITTVYFLNKSTEHVKAYLPEVLDKFKSIVQNVYILGGRYFWIHNTGPLGCLAYALVHRPDIAKTKDSVGCGVIFNEVAKLFNTKLKETVAQLHRDLPQAVLTYVDVYSVKYELISQASRLGFEQPLAACCGHGGGQYNFDLAVGCGGTVQVNGTWVLAGKSCKNPWKRVSWDGIHYTEAANKFVFDKIKGGAYSDPPVPLSTACRRTAKRSS